MGVVSSLPISVWNNDQIPAPVPCHAQRDGPPRRVVITGMGVVSSLGHDHDEFYNNLLAGKSGISMIEVCCMAGTA